MSLNEHHSAIVLLHRQMSLDWRRLWVCGTMARCLIALSTGSACSFIASCRATRARPRTGMHLCLTTAKQAKTIAPASELLSLSFCQARIMSSRHGCVAVSTTRIAARCSSRSASLDLIEPRFVLRASRFVRNNAPDGHSRTLVKKEALELHLLFVDRDSAHA